MSLIFTPLATDNFVPNADPINPAKWTVFTDTSVFGSPRAHTGKFESTQAALDGAVIAGAYYNAVVVPADQYVTATLSNWTLGNNQAAVIVLRSDATGDNQCILDMIDNEDGVTAELSIEEIVNGESNFLYDNLAAIVTAGDVFTFAVVGTTFYAYQNSRLITAIADHQFASGFAGLEVVAQSTLSDCEWSNFIVGSVVSAGGGPVTRGTIFPGPYYGKSLATAFPNAQKLDIMQVVNEGGSIVWNLNCIGVAATNPMSPTPGTLLGVFEGSNFAAAFPNSYQLNVFQIVSPGGAIVFHVDYQGNAVTP